jgi:PTS system arbutin-like IIC component
LQDTSDAETASGTDKSTTLKAFVSGKVIPITKVKDEMFSQKMMGDGIAVYPENEVVTAPADGEITMVMDGSGHAVGMRLVSGVEVLIHIGIDTVKMEGRGFNVLVKQGQKVRAGQALVNFDKKQIEKEGYSSIVILAVTNYTEYPLMKLHSGMTAKADETVIATF